MKNTTCVSALNGAFDGIYAGDWEYWEKEKFLYDIASDKYEHATTPMRRCAKRAIDDLQDIHTLRGWRYRSKDGLGWDGKPKLSREMLEELPP